jgi:hypothetical protein
MSTLLVLSPHRDEASQCRDLMETQNNALVER